MAICGLWGNEVAATQVINKPSAAQIRKTYTLTNEIQAMLHYLLANFPKYMQITYYVRTKFAVKNMSLKTDFNFQLKMYMCNWYDHKKERQHKRGM